MTLYILKRIGALVPVLIGVSIIVFVLMRVMPGDVATMILLGPDGEGQADPESIAELRAQMGLDQPLILQYLSWMWGLITLNPGESLWSGQPIANELATRVPLTLELSGLSLVISLLIALPLGLVSAVKQNHPIDYVVRGFSIGGLALPLFWVASLTILGLTVWADWTPPLGYSDFIDDPTKNIQQLFLPALILGYGNAAIITRMTRSSVLEVLREDYVRTGRSKGLAPTTVFSRHALRNAMLPVLTIAAAELGALLGGSVLMETIFTLPGLGRLLVDSITRRDYPVVQTIIVLMAVVFVVLNLIVDLLYAWLDPRIRLGK